MKFTPKSEADIQASSGSFDPWPSGTYDFEVAEAEDTTSKAGNDMIKLTLYVFNPEGKRRTVFDYLLASIEYKLRHAAEACGLLSAYEQGMLEAFDFTGKTGRLKLGVQPAKDGYDAKNTVRDYVKDDGSTAEEPAPKRWEAPRRKSEPAAAGNIDDEIPW